jgi:hypothetical protein
MVWMAAGAIGTALIAALLAGPRPGLDIVLGMAAPLAAVVATWTAVTRTASRNPTLLTALLLRGFGLKMAFFALYVILAVAVAQVRIVPFIISFTSYFIALYFVEALLLSRLSAAHLRQAR